MSHGRSLALSQNTFIRPPSHEEPPEKSDADEPPSRPKRQANVYDAVAGRLNAHGFLPPVPYPSKYRDWASSTSRPVRPEEVLFRRQNAPVRYEENDRYFAHESLPSDRPLPSSDLLEAIHAYSADFYDRATIDRGQDDYQSMDETALIAMGILMEEMARESLGETGDMVLVEGEEITDDEKGRLSKIKPQPVGRKRANTQSSILPSSGDDTENVVKRKPSKKRKLARRVWKMDGDIELD
ncbi:hypothetical protein P170DRAFT_421436 [Aspergillus steynii IBT 23096]|uniref:Uncharacterized protein n=1 Tax=Aspergillus steynii IBT 23096 TaxID=1392250 RepID=A0A2I2GPH7_9EURO|nr:uncharacterized protein P170DRAFT_421436 [Aspergillus steynii IBT 23096]PLB54784.1 hypothetical protein P170DRAFT_421436 [Aspergillus steynii IBT 23096]